MFTEDELEGVQGAQLEDWLQEHESNLRLIAENRDFKYGRTAEETLRSLIDLIVEAYWLRKTYAS